MTIAIVIPARYGSTRFPGKPLAKIGGRTMLARVAEAANKAAHYFKDVEVLATTEDVRISSHAKEIDLECVMTSKDCATGSDRVLEAVKKTGKKYDFIVNFQGDAPFTPPEVLVKIIEEFKNYPRHEVITPVQRLNWQELDALRESKKTTPFSGTTAIVDKKGRALWFSKLIIPAIRDEAALRKDDDPSPVFQHIGLYGYRADVLEKFCALPQSQYEKLEGLEQLRLLENGVKIQTVRINATPGMIHSGIDSPEDLKRAETMLAKRGSKVA